MFGSRSEDFTEGLIEGVKAYAVWENGELYVGAMKRKLKYVLKEILDQMDASGRLYEKYGIIKDNNEDVIIRQDETKRPRILF